MAHVSYFIFSDQDVDGDLEDGEDSEGGQCFYRVEQEEDWEADV